MTAYIDMSEVERLAHNIELSVELVEGIAESAMAHAAEMTAQRARDMAPRGATGLLASTIYEHKVYTGSGDPEWAITAPQGYAAYVEFGTRRQAPQPFMVPAADEAGEELAESLIRMVRPLR